MSLFIGRLPAELRVRDLEDIFLKYGKIARLDIKRGASYNFGFVEFEDKRDAEDAIKETDGKDLPEFQTRLVVEWAKGSTRKTDRNECFKCGREGHWARDCRDGGGGSPRRRSRSRSRSPYRRRYDDDRRRRDDSRDRDYGRRRDDSRDRERRRDDSRDRGYDRRRDDSRDGQRNRSRSPMN